MSADSNHLVCLLARGPEKAGGGGSIQQGSVTASLILRKLGSYPHQHSLALALREIGRMERTLFTLEWLRDRAQTARDCRTQGEAKSP
jgi:TnpA family transposase